MPFALFIEPTNICNLRCHICPESLPDFQQKAGHYGEMREPTWEAVLADLAKFPRKLKTIRFYGIGEPLMKRDLPKMVWDAKPFTERIEVSTNGARLALRAREIAESPIDYLRISVYGTTNEQIERETGRPLPLLDLFRGALRLRNLRYGQHQPWIHAQLTTPNQDIETFRKQWEGIADDWAVQPLNNWGGTEAQLVPFGRAPVTPRLVCPKPFYEMLISSNGDVSACCIDWDHRLHLGNVNERSLLDIWAGPELAAIRAAHLAGKRGEMAGCRACTLIESQPDNMDGLVKRNGSMQ